MCASKLFHVKQFNIQIFLFLAVGCKIYLFCKVFYKNSLILVGDMVKLKTDFARKVFSAKGDTFGKDYGGL